MANNIQRSSFEVDEPVGWAPLNLPQHFKKAMKTKLPEIVVHDNYEFFPDCF